MLGFVECSRLRYKSRYKYVHNARRYRVLSAASRRAKLDRLGDCGGWAVQASKLGWQW